MSTYQVIQDRPIFVFNWCIRYAVVQNNYVLVFQVKNQNKYVFTPANRKKDLHVK